MRWVRQWGPVLCWAALIYVLSTEHFSSAATSRIIEPLLRWLFSSASRRTIRFIHYLIRKAAHVTEYFIFSLMLFRAFRGKERGWRLSWMVETMALAAFYAGFDEMHQAFVPGREARLSDSLLDTAGAALGQAVLWLWFRWQSKRQEAKAAALDPAK
ncbi:MAG TPA: VanZ family protein [Candidatus Acidoferrales bacterium]|nr:VanZ family protein [Candidatus Acidoferrales bacterium]